MTPSEKVAYIKGLMEGMELDTAKGEGKILASVLDVLEDLALGQEDLQDSIDELNEGLDAVSDDLELVEDMVYGDEDEYDDEDEDDECCCHHHHHHHGDGDEECEYEVECPACGAQLVLSEEDLDQGVVDCPECGETLELELTEEEDDDDDDDEEYDAEDLEPEE